MSKEDKLNNEEEEAVVEEEVVEEEKSTKSSRSRSSSSVEVQIVFNYPFRLGHLVQSADGEYFLLPRDIHEQSRQRVQEVKKAHLIPADFDSLEREVPNLRKKLKLDK